ncbi:N-acetyllactosaminide 3-alpha-galactosyltransferase [Trichuris suis]|nr:N-acetyllactosaminide 3-alpha-galactosyltransferase [Trichuris suis]
MQSLEQLMARNRFKEWTIAERLLFEFTCAALTLLFIVLTISLYRPTSLGPTMPLLPFPKRVNLTILPHFVNCTASTQSNGSTEVKLVIVLKTRVEEVEQRRAIRETWASQLRWPVVFAVGKSVHSAHNLNIINESSIYGDILQADFIDSYFNLSLKSLSILQWMVEYCAQVDLFVQGDSDMLFSPTKLEHLASARRYRANEIYGCLYERTIVRHFDKWAVNPISYPYMYYPDYCSGRIFLMTNDVPEALLSAHRQRVSRLPHCGYISVDDAYFTGIIAFEAGVKRTNEPSIIFLPEHSAFVSETEVCRALAIGEFKTPELMRQAWNKFQVAYNTCTNA